MLNPHVARAGSCQSAREKHCCTCVLGLNLKRCVHNYQTSNVTLLADLNRLIASVIFTTKSLKYVHRTSVILSPFKMLQDNKQYKNNCDLIAVFFPLGSDKVRD